MPISPDKLKAARAKRGLSQTELAVRAALPQPTIGRIEGGRQCNVLVDTAKRIADALGVKIDALME